MGLFGHWADTQNKSRLKALGLQVVALSLPFGGLFILVLPAFLPFPSFVIPDVQHTITSQPDRTLDSRITRFVTRGYIRDNLDYLYSFLFPPAHILPF